MLELSCATCWPSPPLSFAWIFWSYFQWQWLNLNVHILWVKAENDVDAMLWCIMYFQNTSCHEFLTTILQKQVWNDHGVQRREIIEHIFAWKFNLLKVHIMMWLYGNIPYDAETQCTPQTPWCGDWHGFENILYKIEFCAKNIRKIKVNKT